MNLSSPSDGVELILARADRRVDSARAAFYTPAHPALDRANPTITLIINGQSTSADVDPDTPLLWVIRERLRLTGTKFGCGQTEE